MSLGDGDVGGEEVWDEDEEAGGVVGDGVGRRWVEE